MAIPNLWIDTTNLGQIAIQSNMTAADNLRVLKSGDTMSGALTVNGDIASYRAGAPTSGLIQFGNQSGRYLYYDGTNYTLNGGGTLTVNGNLSVVNGDVTFYRSGAPTAGLIYFGNSGNRYLYYDGTNFNFSGGNVTFPAIIGVASSVNVSYTGTPSSGSTSSGLNMDTGNGAFQLQSYNAPGSVLAARMVYSTGGTGSLR